MSDRPLTREDILTAPDLPAETMTVPRWGGTVLVKAMAMGHPRYIQYWAGRHNENLPAAEQQARKYVGAAIMSALDPDTEKPLFTFKDADDLREKHYNSVVLVATRAMQLAGNSDAEEKEIVLQNIIRVATHADQNDWPEPLQEALTDMAAYLYRDADGGEQGDPKAPSGEEE